MPPKKRKRQSRKTTQSQRQSQKVIVNIGSKSAPRKRSGRGGLPPPSHMHNLAPTFVTAPQVDYTPILAMLTQQTRSLQPEPVRNPVTPLSSATQTAEQMAGAAAIRRAGPTAANFQPPPSLADERMIETLLQSSRPRPSKPKTNMVERRSMGAEDRDAPQQALRPPIPYVTQQLVPQKSAEDLSAPVAEARFVDPPSAQQAEVVGSKTPPRQKQQSSEKRDIKDIIDQKLESGEPLTQAEISKAMQTSAQIGKGRVKKLIKAGYTQFEK
jgi:hypothetical protein